MFRSIIISLSLSALAVVFLPVLGAVAYIEAEEISIQINGESGDTSILVDTNSEEVINQSNSVNIDNTTSANAQTGYNEVANGTSTGTNTGQSTVSTNIQQSFNINSTFINCPCDVSDGRTDELLRDLSTGLQLGTNQFQEEIHQPIKNESIFPHVTNYDSHMPYKAENVEGNLGNFGQIKVEENRFEVLGLGDVSLPIEHDKKSNEKVPAVPYSTANLPLLLSLVFGNSNLNPKMAGIISTLFSTLYFSLIFSMIFTFCTVLLTGGFLRFSSGVSPPLSKLLYAQY